MKRVLLQAILVAAFLVVSLGSTQAEGQGKVVFSVPIKTNVLGLLPGLALEEKGYWKQMGLNVEWIAFGSGRAQRDALAAGAVNASTTLSTGALVGIARGLPIIIVADMKVRTDFFVWVRSGSPIKQPTDLKGKKIAVPRKGSVAQAYVTVLARDLGLEKDIGIVGSGGVRAAVAALRKGAVDAMMISHFVMARLKYQGAVRAIESMRKHLPGEWMDNVIIARRDIVSRRPGDLRKMIRGWALAAEFVRGNPNWAVQKMKTRLRYSEGLAREIVPFLSWGKSWKIDPQAVKNLRDFVVEYGMIKKKRPKIEDLYTNKFVS